ncbi:MAG: DUF1269 domain-containing protein [Gaiellales bacterium]
MAAEQGLHEVEQLAGEKLLSLKDAVIAVKNGDRVELDQTKELSVGQGAIVGGVAGTLLGLALGVVTGGALAGLAAGGIAGAFDTGIKNERLRQLAADLEPGHALLGLLIGKADWEALSEHAATLGGEPLVLELTPEAHEALERRGPDEIRPLR